MPYLVMRGPKGQSMSLGPDRQVAGYLVWPKDDVWRPTNIREVKWVRA